MCGRDLSDAAAAPRGRASLQQKSWLSAACRRQPSDRRSVVRGSARRQHNRWLTSVKTRTDVSSFHSPQHRLPGLYNATSDYYAAFHHKPNTLQLGDISDGVPSNGDQIGKLARLDSADAVLPS